MFFRKDIILYDKHRQTQPLVENTYNRQKFLFFDVNSIWKSIPFKTTDKRKHKIMYCILSCIHPKYIISMNWISQRESLYKVWTAKHPVSKFIVVQHGAYTGGIVVDADIDHRFTKCDIFLVWGNYFENLFREYNKGKNVKIVSFGNPVYNMYKREKFTYKEKHTGNVLLLPTALDEGALKHFCKLVARLEELGFNVLVKAHGMQGKVKDNTGKLIFPKMKFLKSTTSPVFEILPENDFDFIVSDYSSALLDAVFFKNQVILFDSTNRENNSTYYSVYLQNLFLQKISAMNKTDFYNFLDINKQEDLLNKMVDNGNNQLISI